MNTRNQLTEAVLAARYIDGKKQRPWRDVAEQLYSKLDSNATGALLNKIVLHPEYMPGPDVCRKLDLYEPKLTDPCPDCGAVHTLGVCVAKSVVKVTVIKVTPEELAAIDNPVIVTVKQSIVEKRRRARASINLEDPESAARTISKKMDAQTLAALLQLLSEANL